MKKILTEIPYTEGQMGKRQQHRANSNVHLLVVKGQITATLSGQDLVAAKGALVRLESSRC